VLARYDVIIVGAGPGGALLAYLLARQGVTPLIIDQHRLPRYKACGGGLTRRSLEALPFSVDGVIEDYSYQAVLTVGNRPVLVKRQDHPIIGMVMRDKFDFFLVEQAEAAGAVLSDQTGFRSLSGPPGDLTIETSRGDYGARIVVGADGVNGRVARALGLSVRRDLLIALESEVYLDHPKRLDAFHGTAYFDYGVIPGGYGWIFPKKDHLSVGIGSMAWKKIRLKRHLNHYMELKGLTSRTRIKTMRGHAIPYRPDQRNNLANSQGLLVGDAAGITDPVSGEGIYHALRQAHLASAIIIDALESGNQRLEQYNEIIKREFLGDLRFAQRLGTLLFKYPRFGGRVLEHHGHRLADHVLRITAGHESYRDLYRRMFRLTWLPALLASKPGRDTKNAR